MFNATTLLLCVISVCWWKIGQRANWSPFFMGIGISFLASFASAFLLAAIESKIPIGLAAAALVLLEFTAIFLATLLIKPLRQNTWQNAIAFGIGCGIGKISQILFYSLPHLLSFGDFSYFLRVYVENYEQAVTLFSYVYPITAMMFIIERKRFLSLIKPIIYIAILAAAHAYFIHDVGYLLPQQSNPDLLFFQQLFSISRTYTNISHVCFLPVMLGLFTAWKMRGDWEDEFYSAA